MMIDVLGGKPQPMTPPASLGAAFAAIIAEALTWDEARRTDAEQRQDRAHAHDVDGYDEASERVAENLANAGLDWSCQFGEPDNPAEAGPYIDTLSRHVSYPASEVAAAVLARDLHLVTAKDFAVLTGWWTAAGWTLPDPRDSARNLFAANDDEAEQNAYDLNSNRHRIAGWPLAAVA